MPLLPAVRSFDVVVVGLGPAGATAAYECSRSGLAVLAFDKGVHPRYKVCGGGLSARIDQVLGGVFDTVIEHVIYGVRFAYADADSFTIESSSPIAYMVMRDRFDHCLVERARWAGTEIRQGESAKRFTPVADGLEIETEHGRYGAKVLIGADGANSVVAQQLFSRGTRRCMPTLESEIDIGQSPVYPREHLVGITIGPPGSGYGWIFPKDKRLSVGIAEFRGPSASPRQVFSGFVQREEGLRSRGWKIPPPQGHPLPLFHPCSRDESRSDGVELVNGRTMLIGDAAHLVDPLFGEGIYYAVKSGQLAARSAVEFVRGLSQDLEGYRRVVYREIYPEFQVASRMASILYSFPRLCYRLAHRYQEVVQLYYRVLQGQESYRTFLELAKRSVKVSLSNRFRNAFRVRP
ncbi:MAG: NAD(P)/FAD-dependent oxidoreductase [Nitrospiraceae bacterium]